VCNAVAVASLLNATLVIPRFLFSNVWKDPSQFGDIYQEDYFMKTLKDDVNIAKDLPPHLQSPDFKEIGSLVTDADISMEATQAEYIEKILPVLLKNGVVHFLGYGNRLGFDPLPSDLQRVRCKCNYHALKFVPKIQETEDLLTPYELAPFKNFSSQLAALDFIACATADVFAITDSGSQQSSLVSGFRTYYGGGRAPTLRPSKMRLAKILSENQTISWKDFVARVTNMITEAQTVRLRARGRSIYNQPRCHECMCKFQ
nr:O-fucosyltransferase 8 isoform X2 [Tanacetum cinerariifolium]